jgi:hypothetical protein
MLPVPRALGGPGDTVSSLVQHRPEQLGAGRYHRGSASLVIQHHQVSPLGLGDHSPRLGADQHRRQVVPHPMGVGAHVAPRIQGARSHGTDVQSRSSERSELAPSVVMGGQAADAEDRLADLETARNRQLHPVAGRPLAANRAERSTRCVIGHMSHRRPIGVHETQRRRKPAQTSTGIRGSVQGVQYHHRRIRRPLASTLLGQHLKAGAEQALHTQRVHVEVHGILPGAVSRQAPVTMSSEQFAHLAGQLTERGQSRVKGEGRHSTDGSVQIPWCVRSKVRHDVAVIDVAGFVADIKSQAIDHGFHVHDERHFVETYSLRQLWEVDLHPEEACSGPIDLHLSLDVDPRALLGFEDEIVKLDDIDDDPPTGFSFPLLFTWTLPPLPHPPDLLVLATELAGVGGMELPVEVSAIDSFLRVTDAPERSLSIVARQSIDLAEVYLNNDATIASSLERCKHVSLFLLERADAWLEEI